MSIQAANTVSRETLEKLENFRALVVKWNPIVNLVSRQSLPDLWQRHIVDSLQLLPFVPERAAHWVDLGSGGGFPGLVVAVVAHDLGKQTRFTLVESDQRKSAFLREAARQLHLTVNILSDRIEALPYLEADIVSARALAPLNLLCDMAYLHLKPGGKALFMKGRGHAAELQDARKAWSFDLVATQSATDPDAAILELSSLRKVP